MVLQALLLVLETIYLYAIGLSSYGIWIKNRPLPPGEAFDPYREKDFHRRKAEGFLPPLYKSNIPTGDSIVFTEDFTKNKNSQENNAISKKNSIKKKEEKNDDDNK